MADHIYEVSCRWARPIAEDAVARYARLPQSGDETEDWWV